MGINTKEYMRQWREKNKAKIDAYNKAWGKANRDKQRANSRRSYLKHKDKILAKHREWRAKNPERMLNLCLRWQKENRERAAELTRNYRARNIDLCRERDRNWMMRKRKSDPAFKILCNCRVRVYDLLTGRIDKSASTVELLGCDGEFLKKHLESQWLPGMSWDNHGKADANRKTWQIDHIVPCTAFDLTDPEQQRKCFHYSNLQPLWAIDNIRKGGAKSPRLDIQNNS